MMKLPMTLVAITALAVATPASATVLSFTISGDYSASFTIDTSVPPVFSDPNFGVGYGFVSGSFGMSIDLAHIQFFPTITSGGVLIGDAATNDWLLEAAGPQLYTGPETAPLFLLGTFDLVGLTTPGNFTMTIATAVPEPASWALMIAGFGLAGAALRRRNVASVRYAIG